MNSHVLVPYDEALLRRTIEYILQPHVKRFRPIGIALVVLGVLMAALDVSRYVLWAPMVVAGVFCAFVVKPMMIGSTVKQQWSGIKADFRLDADEEWVSFSYPAFQSRIRWEAMEKVVETPDAWLLVLGKIQATAVPRSAMTPEQVAEFTALLARRRPPVAA